MLGSSDASLPHGGTATLEKRVLDRHWHLPQSYPSAWITAGVRARQRQHLLDVDLREEKALFLLHFKNVCFLGALAGSERTRTPHI